MRQSQTARFKRVTTALLLGALVLALSSSTTSAKQKSGRSASARRNAPIAELLNTGQLKEAFERDAGKVRMFALLSPT